ncbi:MAG TPA: hypothetical protein VF521_06925, partial [Pyrinomonadaceae bacterium]
ARNAFISYVNGHSSSWTLYALTPVDASAAGSGATCDGLSGTSGSNIVNRTSAGRGLQLELGYGLRSDLVNGDPGYDALRNVVYGAIYQAMTGAGSTPTGSADVVECGSFSVNGGSISEVTQGTDGGCTGFTPAFHFADETSAGGGAYYAWHNSATGTITFPVTSTTAPVAHLSVSFRVYGHTAAGSAAVYARSTAGQWIQVGTIGSEQAPDWAFATVDVPLSPPSAFLPSSPNAYPLPVRIVTTGAIGELDIDRAYLNVSSGTPATATYPVHRGIPTTWFYVGEPAGPDNDYIANFASAWDDSWRYHYTGTTDTSVRDYPYPVRGGPNYYPNGYTPRENPFYVALPYNDFDEGGAPRSNRASVVYWGGSGTWSSSQSMCKNRWVKVSYGGRSAYAQWEDVGPANEDDAAYVFGTAAPRNSATGLDLSPAVRDYLRIDPDAGVVQADWQFVEASEVEPGPWMNIVTARQVCWDCPD